MAEVPMEPVDSAEDNEPDTLATPEGDGEGLPDVPLTVDEPEVERPRGDGPHSEEPLRDALG